MTVKAVEIEEVIKGFREGAEAVITFLKDGKDAAMNQYNRKKDISQE